MSWGAKDSSSDTTYTQKFVWYRNGGFNVNDSIKFYGNDFYIHNGNTADIYRNIDMHNWAINNANIVSSSDRRLKENIIDSSRFELKIGDATVSVDPEYSYLIETQVIEGKKYILIPADAEAEINGFPVQV